MKLGENPPLPKTQFRRLSRREYCRITPVAIPDYAFLNQNPVCAVQNPVNNETIPARPDSPQPGPSGIQHQNTTPNKSTAADNITPGKALDEVSPVPVVSFAVKRARKKNQEILLHLNLLKTKKRK